MLDTPSVSPIFGEHHAQLRMVGAAFYIDDLTFLGERLSLPCVGTPTAARLDPISAERRCGLNSTTSWLPNADSRAGSPDPSLQARLIANIAPTSGARRRTGSMSGPQKVASEPSTSPPRNRQLSIKGRAR